MPEVQIVFGSRDGEIIQVAKGATEIALSNRKRGKRELTVLAINRGIDGQLVVDGRKLDAT